MTREVTGGEVGHLDVARQLTELQMQTAQKLVQDMFPGSSNQTLYAAVLQALAQNYNTTRMYSKAVFKS